VEAERHRRQQQGDADRYGDHRCARCFQPGGTVRTVSVTTHRSPHVVHLPTRRSMLPVTCSTVSLMRSAVPSCGQLT